MMKPAADVEIEPGDAEPITVLHVDDDPNIVDLAATCLESEASAITVETETRAEAALQQVAEDGIDCVVSDYDMPAMDGLEFLETIRSDHPDLPFILFTGKGSEEIASEAISAGVTDYLQKGGGVDQYAVLANRIENAVAQYRAERAVERTRERFSKLVEHSSDIIFAVDANGINQYVTPSLEHILGYSPEELTGENAFEYVHPDDRELATDAFFEAIEDPDSQPRVEFRAQHKNGSWRTLEVRGRNLLDDPVVEGFVVNARDITERKERERELERYETMADTAGDMAYILDTEGRFQFVNDAAATLTGYSRDELVGEHVELLMEREDIETGRALIKDLLAENGSGDAFEWTLHTADGETVPCESHITLLIDDGEWRGTVGVVRDITDRKERERELRRQNERLEKFGSLLSHELRNPLNIAQTGVDLVQQTGEDHYLEEIELAHEHMERLIEDMLTLARQGRTVGETESVRFDRVVEDAWSAMETDGGELVVDGQRHVEADHRRLRQLLSNLFRNAVEHGGENVTVNVGLLDGESGFYVEDDGPGISNDELDRVFEAGYSTANASAGLGLAIVRDIVEAHGWSVEITDGVSGGTRFEIGDVTFV